MLNGTTSPPTDSLCKLEDLNHVSNVLHVIALEVQVVFHMTDLHLVAVLVPDTVGTNLDQVVAALLALTAVNQLPNVVALVPISAVIGEYYKFYHSEMFNLIV